MISVADKQAWVVGAVIAASVAQGQTPSDRAADHPPALMDVRRLLPSHSDVIIL